jgi:nucleotide-binding universal stress UspA family protein
VDLPPPPRAHLERGTGEAVALIIVAYDGSPDARRAIEVAAGLFSRQPAVVVTVWHLPVAAVDPPMASVGEPAATSIGDELEVVEAGSRRVVDEGVSLARGAGLNASPRLVRAEGVSGTARALLDVAEERGADLVVVGRRGVSRIKAMVLGSVSDAALKDGRRPVLVVPHGD